MRVEVLTESPPDQYTELGLEAAAATHLPEGVTTSYPLMLDVRDPEGLLLYRFHVTQAGVDTLQSALDKIKNHDPFSY